MAVDGWGDLLSGFDRGLLVDLLAVIDAEIMKVDNLIARESDPDGSGLLDRAESLYGLGLVACQQYLNSCYRWSGLHRPTAVARGPMYSPNTSYALVVDAAANYWKHHGEWDGAGKFEAKTRSVLDRLVPSKSNYLTSNVLHELLGKPATLRLSDLVPWLERWRDGLKTT
jgi:hypothetical protein